MADLFDGYRSTYGDVVQDSIGFSGLKHDFFMVAKAELIGRLVESEGLRKAGKGPKALDVGCGVGTLHRYVRGLFGSLDGCDISAESIARAGQDNPGVEYRAYSPPTLPYENASFDFAFASCVVHHVPPASWPVFFTELKRVLRPGGIACIIEHNPLNPLTRLAVYRCPFDEDAVLLGPGKVGKLYREAGFGGVRSEHFLLLPTSNRIAATVERAFKRLPLGAQYASIARA